MNKTLALLLSLLVCSTAFCKTKVTVETTADDMTPVLSAIFEKYGKNNIEIVFPKGTYHFYREKAFGKYHPMTNQDNGYRNIIFPLIGCRNVTIDGSGSDFVFHEVEIPFVVENSKNVNIKNLSINWEEPFHIQGTVIARNEEESTVDLQMTDFSRYTVRNGRIIIHNNGCEYPDLGKNMVWDPATSAVAWNCETHSLLINEPFAVVSEIGEKQIRIKGDFKQHPAEIGQVYSFKGPNGLNRIACAIHLTNAKDVKLENIDIYDAAAVGVLGEHSWNISLDDVNVCLKEGSGRFVSITADATHFCNCRGNLTVENCLFENMLDDATNVHGTYLKVVEVLGPKTVLAKISHPKQSDYLFAEKRDNIQFVNGETMELRGCAKVRKVEKFNDRYYRISFSKNIPVGVSPDDGLENLTWYPQLVFRNNVVRNNRARSVLLSSPGGALIEGNTFSSMMTSILFEGDLDYWYESGAAKDVIIRNNTFLDNCYGGNDASVIWINPHAKSESDAYQIESNIVIENNSFKTFDPSILRAKSVKGLVFRSNTIEPTNHYPHILENLEPIMIENCPDAIIENNTFKDTE